jgi:hypothetical protein
MRSHKSTKRKSLTGMSDEDVAARIQEQGYQCPICVLPYSAEHTRKPSVDHRHSLDEQRHLIKGRGPNRDVICHGCNTMLGYARDNANTLRRAADYIDAHNERLAPTLWDALINANSESET